MEKRVCVGEEVAYSEEKEGVSILEKGSVLLVRKRKVKRRQLGICFGNRRMREGIIVNLGI